MEIYRSIHNIKCVRNNVVYKVSGCGNESLDQRPCYDDGFARKYQNTSTVQFNLI